jgi:hypothetical protein
MNQVKRFNNKMTTLLPHELHLLQYIFDIIIPMYEDFLRRELSTTIITRRQSNAISSYCGFYKLPINFDLPGDGEFDMNSAHTIFEHMKKHISF